MASAIALTTLGVAGIAHADTQIDSNTVRVDAGDTVSEIANAHQVSIDQLIKDNHLANANLIYVGDKLSVNSSVAQANTTTQAPQTTSQASNTQAKQTTMTAPKTNTVPSQSASTSNVASSSEQSAKDFIAQKESGGSYTASNPSGAYGKYQLKSYNLKYGTSPSGQERAASEYVTSRYGSWNNAKSFWLQHNWY